MNKKMLIVISNPVDVPRENRMINQLLHEGIDYFHIRKPDASKETMEAFIRNIHPDHYQKLVLHSHYDLALEYNVKGVHITQKNKHLAVKWLKSNLQVSNSVHSIDEFKENLGKGYAYSFISPVFDSISKKNYHSTIRLDEVRFLMNNYREETRLIALGGICRETITHAIDAGFHGCAVLGSVWDLYSKNNDIAITMNEISLMKQLCSKENTLSA